MIARSVLWYDDLGQKGGKNIIFCVEDDESIQSLELYALQSAGFEVRGFADGDSFLEALRTELPQLVILDVMLPGKSGVELLKLMKESSATREIAVIMATAKGAEYDKIQSLDLGADDYLVKPFGMMEMVSRVKAVLRRCHPRQNPEILAANDLVIDLAEHTVMAGGERVSLTYKEFELLRLFMSSPGVAFTREKLLTSIWDSDYSGETRTVDMHIRTLRQKLGSYGAMIETIRNVGYRLEVKP